MIEYSNNSLSIYKKLYFAEGETRPEQTHDRVAQFIANNEKEYEDFKWILDEKIFRPNTPCLISAGVGGNNSWDRNLSGCFVMGMEDSMESIIDVWSTCSKIYAGGAGSGIPITNLREEGAPIGGNKGKASGSLNYLHVIESVANTVKSGGRHRRASNLASAKYNHPDIFKIIDAKSEEGKLSSFNISILVDDWFMRNVENGENFVVDLISPSGNKKISSTNGIEIWNKIIENSHKSGDPGLLFFDTANKVHPFEETIESSNPCGEVLLPPWSVCNLGSINLSKCINYDGDNPEFDYGLLSNYIKIAVKFMDNVIDKTDFVHEKFRERSYKERPTGLGIMSFSDVLFELKIPYNSQDAIFLFESICETLTREAIKQSINLAKEKGSIDTSYSKLRELIFYYTNDQSIVNDFDKYGIRNSTVTSIAPTGSISISADCSYSFEPCFALVWTKELAETHEMLYFVNPVFEKWLDNSWNTLCLNKDEVLKDIAKNNGSIQDLLYIPGDIKKVFVTAHDIDPIDKLKIQSAGQRYITLGISSTCNLPNSATKEDISNIYIEAWKRGLKGITVYRDGCKSWQPVNFGQKECKEEIKSDKYVRPIKRSGETYEVKTPDGSLYLTINKDESTGNPIEVFLRMGKQGNKINLLIDALSRCVSKGLQNGVSLSEFASTLRGNKEDTFYFRLDEKQETPYQAESVIDAIGIILEYVASQKTDIKLTDEKGNMYELCPNCGKYTLTRSSGCKGGNCLNSECLYTSCG